MSKLDNENRKVIPQNVTQEGFGRYEVMDVDMPVVPETPQIVVNVENGNTDSKRFPKIRKACKVAKYSLIAVGALSIANQFSDLGLPFGQFFDRGEAVTQAEVGDVKTEVIEYSGKVTAEINSTVDIDVTRSLSNFGIEYCEQAVHENDLPLNGLLVVDTKDITVTAKGKRAEVRISKFDTPVLAMPIDKPILSESGSGTNVCVQKDPGEYSKDLSDKQLEKRRKIKETSPENEPIVIATKILKATSTRIGECVLNEVNDEGTAVNKLLSKTIAEDVANDRGISPKDVDVFFDFEDSNKGIDELNSVKEQIIKDQKEKADAKVKINLKEVLGCEAHDISAILSSNEPIEDK